MTPAERAATSAQSVASLRNAMTQYPEDRDLQALVASLRERSEQFARLWEQSPAAPWLSHTKTICTRNWARSPWTASP